MNHKIKSTFMRPCPQNSDLQWPYFTVTVKVLKLFWESYYAKVTFKSLPDEQMPMQEKIYSVQVVLNVRVYSVYGILAFVVWIHILRMKIISRYVPLRSKEVHIYLKENFTKQYEQKKEKGKFYKLIWKITPKEVIFNNSFRLTFVLDFITVPGTS